MIVAVLHARCDPNSFLRTGIPKRHVDFQMTEARIDGDNGDVTCAFDQPGLAAPSTLQGATFSTWLASIAAIISACGFEPDLAETAFQSSAADVIAVRRYSVSNPDLPRRFTIGQVTEDKKTAVVPPGLRRCAINVTNTAVARSLRQDGE